MRTPYEIEITVTLKMTVEAEDPKDAERIAYYAIKEGSRAEYVIMESAKVREMSHKELVDKVV